MAKTGRQAHKAASRVVYYALTLDDPFGWERASWVLGVRLSERELSALAWAALAALDEEPAYNAATVGVFGYLPARPK